VTARSAEMIDGVAECGAASFSAGHPSLCADWNTHGLDLSAIGGKVHPEMWCILHEEQTVICRHLQEVSNRRYCVTIYRKSVTDGTVSPSTGSQ
jgi:hypothetical protein